MRHETPPLIIAGASRGVGLALAWQERAIGRPVVALVRPSSDCTLLQETGATIMPGDALSPDDATRLFAECPTDCDVVSTIGGVSADGRRADDEGNINLIDAAVQAGIRGRFLLVTSIGCGNMAPYRSERAIAAFGAAVDAKTGPKTICVRMASPGRSCVRAGSGRSRAPAGVSCRRIPNYTVSSTAPMSPSWRDASCGIPPRRKWLSLPSIWTRRDVSIPSTRFPLNDWKSHHASQYLDGHPDRTTARRGHG